MKAEQYRSFLIPVVMAKLPDDVRLQIACVTTKDVWEMDKLVEVLCAEVAAREISEGVRVHDSRSFNANSHQKHKSDRFAIRSIEGVVVDIINLFVSPPPPARKDESKEIVSITTSSVAKTKPYKLRT